jgi:hypothetical protein
VFMWSSFRSHQMLELKRKGCRVAGLLLLDSQSALLRKRQKSCVEKEVVVMYVLFVYVFPISRPINVCVI